MSLHPGGSQSLTYGSLFSGYGGLDMGVQSVLGGRTAWHSDICKVNRDGTAGHHDPHRAPCAILAHHHPDVPNLGDIGAIDWSGMKTASNRKLTPDQVQSAVRMYSEVGMSLAPIAEYFGVSRQAMWDLLRRRTQMRDQKRYGQENHFWRGGPTSDGRAHDITEKALEKGLLVRPERCETCGQEPASFTDGRAGIQAHHVDYNRPLDVMWLCQPCHHDWHRTNTAVAVTGGEAKGELSDIDVMTGGFP